MSIIVSGIELELGVWSVGPIKHVIDVSLVIDVFHPARRTTTDMIPAMRASLGIAFVCFYKAVGSSSIFFL